MRALGLNSYFHCSSACLVENGMVRAAVQEERLVRRKLSSEFPFRSIAWCLKQGGLSLDNLDCVTFPVDLAIYLEHFNRAQASSLRYRGELSYAISNALISLSRSIPEASSFSQEWKIGPDTHKIRFVNHHLAHAAHAFFLSPFEEAAILTMDAFGEKACQLAATGKGSKIQPLAWSEFPHSLGCFYATMTEFLGFQPNSEEWKLMGASSYGNPDRFLPALSSLIKVAEGRLELDLSYFNFYQFHRPGYYSPKLIELLGPPREKGKDLTPAHFDLAAAVQKVTEETVFKIVAWLREKTGCRNLCLGGGVFQNSVLNGKLKARTGFGGIYIPSAPDDSGGAIGAALYHLHQEQNVPRESKTQYNYWGPAYSDDEIAAALRLSKWPYWKLSQPETSAARVLQDGQILGWFQGGLEFGDRALGNRSILGDPRNPDIKDYINASVKFREQFRPFAPSILAERADDYFVQSDPTPFMEKVYPIRPEKRKEIPSVTHVDGSGRLQTVSREQNPRYYRLIQEFERLTGTPVVLNTSFNTSSEPIVGSPEDAIRTFSACGLDVLIIGDYLLAKDPARARAWLP